MGWLPKIEVLPGTLHSPFGDEVYRARWLVIHWRRYLVQFVLARHPRRAPPDTG